ncbi:type I-E CRISPR-associated endoribonuclease Cas2e [Cryobacterium roopkundense]|uniref:CRISPR-associated protein Cas2 n=1 Tax=Cryobacterium roopkundense TaxID=1001240 RepID=A0A7W9A0S6_9MICO|nr:CRISPR-associated protein Cas2 [Cryobacterium roopkundense]
MFVTLRITAVPDHLRGYLSRFLVEYGTGLYVGNVSRRIVDSLWSRVTDAAGEGEIVLVTSEATNEQGFKVRLHQGRGKEVVDMDGFELLRSIPEGAYYDSEPFPD